ncbi:MAG: hypothetical protein ACSHYF_17375 [Verrucomicrobiaceae bacterium]
MLYFLRPWNENRGDQYSGWGFSVWYFEVDGTGNVVRQIEAYESGKIVRYDESSPSDEFGGLAECPIDLDEFEQCAITKDEFENRWSAD